MSTEAHAEVPSREVDVLMLPRGSIRMAAEGEWTTAETERERERERRKTNAPRTPRRRARRLRPEDEGGTWAPSGAHDASVERRERAWAPKQELERAKARGVKHRRVPRMHVERAPPRGGSCMRARARTPRGEHECVCRRHRKVSLVHEKRERRSGRPSTTEVSERRKASEHGRRLMSDRGRSRT